MLRLLVVDDDPGDVRLLRLTLGRMAGRQEHHLAVAENLADALEHLLTNEVDLVLLDLGLPDSQGIGTVDKVSQEFGAVPIVVLTGLASEEAGLEALRRGASDYLVKGKYDADQLLRTIRYSRERKWLERQLVELAMRDPLTGALNRRAFDDALRRKISLVERGASAALVMFDVDHFKRVNDTLGHDAGDQVLVKIAEIARNMIRPTDDLTRLGGDEFVVLIDCADISEALAVGERIRQSVENLQTASPAGAGPTLSMGAVMINAGSSPEAILASADERMYRSKSGGRNRICA